MKGNSTRFAPLVFPLVCLFALPPTLSGCGGGGGGSAAGSAAALDEDRREAALDQVTAKVTSLQGASRADRDQQVAQYLASLPEFSEAGVVEGGGGAWGRFQDGLMFVYIDNRSPAGRAARLTSANLRGRAAIIPDESKVQIFQGFEDRYNGGGADTVRDLRNWTTQKGYVNVGSSESASVENLRTKVNGPGIFYFNSHGGMTGPDKGGNVGWCLWTTTKASKLDILDRTLQDDLKAGRLVYSVAEVGEDDNKKEIAEKHYSITAGFVEKYMHFSPHSLVWLDACLSQTEKADTFRNACFANGAGAYVGWTGFMSNENGYAATKFVFDRLLGVNQNANKKEVPPQRPFDIDRVIQDMFAQRLGKFTDSLGLEVRLVATTNPSLAKGFALLAPSIEHMEMAEYQTPKPQLTIRGIFGDDPGESNRQVTVGGADVFVRSWKPTEIVVDVPFDLSGNVVVSVRGHESNAVPLTDFRTTFTYTYSQTPVNVDTTGTVQQTLKFDLHFRADVHTFRTKPHESINGEFLASAIPAPDSNLHATASGFLKLVDGEGTLTHLETWSGSGDANPSYSLQTNSTFIAPVELAKSGSGRALRIYLHGSVSKAKLVQSKHNEGGTIIDDPDIRADIDGPVWGDGTDGVPADGIEPNTNNPYIEIPLTATFFGSAGHREGKSPAESESGEVWRLEWTDIRATNAPMPEKGEDNRSAKLTRAAKPQR